MSLPHQYGPGRPQLEVDTDEPSSPKDPFFIMLRQFVPATPETENDHNWSKCPLNAASETPASKNIEIAFAFPFTAA
ncbi:hypothetical protein UA08_09069 [Talaromyces atroroseus]|uniref:Uncharacterized protein n=1 Tax=Talaromyces atroroseus TaxID=1441469 RepID=A0A1Q5Q791_TALAT|nr:hypothetical protein UA08_09069 [Talaromyces atroroseus]OKL55715.1 hypothetical protein UA08_09069 [Talaromyces atroroseus]